MNTVTIKRSHFTIILMATGVLLIFVISQYLRRPMPPLTPNAIKFLETLREARAATIVSPDGGLLVFSGGSDPTPVEKCGQSEHTEIPAGCKPDSLENPSNHNVMDITIYKGKPGSSRPTIFISTQGSPTNHYKPCPDWPVC